MRSSPEVVRPSCGSRLHAAFRVLACVGIASVAVVFSGCGYWINPNAVVPSGPGTPNQNGSVTISTTYVALSPGQKFQFTASSSSGGQIEWLVNSTVGGQPQTGEIDTAGNFTAPSLVSQGIYISVTA